MLGTRNQKAINKLLGILYYLDLKGKATRYEIGELIKDLEPEANNAPDALSLRVSRQIAILRSTFGMDIQVVSPREGFVIRRWGAFSKEGFRKVVEPLFPELPDRVAREIEEDVRRKAEVEKAKADAERQKARERAEKIRLREKEKIARAAEKKKERAALRAQRAAEKAAQKKAERAAAKAAADAAKAEAKAEKPSEPAEVPPEVAKE